MHSFYEQLVNGSGNNGGSQMSSIQNSNSYLSFLANNPDFLNSSQNEKSWLNSSLGEKNWLNNSLSLPPEQRYHALNEMVAKIVEDDILAASGNSSSLFNSFKAAQHHQQQNSFQQAFKPKQNFSFQRQDSRPKELASAELFVPNPKFESQTSINNNNNKNEPNQPRFPEYQLDPSAAAFTNPKFKIPPGYQVSQQAQHQQKQQQVQSVQMQPYFFESGLNNFNPYNNNNFVYQYAQQKPQQQQQLLSNPSDQMMRMQQLQQPVQAFQNDSESQVKQNGLMMKNGKLENKTNDRPNTLINSSPNKPVNFHFMNGNNPSLQNLNSMPLAFPASFSHHLATLSADQQNYLLQQQRALVLALAATEAQNQHLIMNPNGYIYHQIPHQLNNQLQIHHQTDHASLTPVSPQTFKSQISSSSSSKSSNFSSPTTSFNKPDLNNNNSSFINQNPINHINSQPDNSLQINRLNHQFSKISLSPQTPNEMSLNREFHLNSGTPNLEQFNLENFIDGSQPGNNNGMILNNDKLRFMNKQPYRHHRRTGPANELHVRLEECLYQFKCLESERKKIETELSHINFTRKYAFNNGNSGLNLNYMIPRLPPNPSRVDRLVVESSKEHAKVVTLVSKIDNLKDTIFYQNIQHTFQKWFEAIRNVEAKRKDELINSANRQRLGQSARSTDERDVTVLANAINGLTILTSRARTSLWCAVQISNVNYNQSGIIKDNLQSSERESMFDTIPKTQDFIEKTFEIKTDLIEYMKNTSKLIGAQ